MTLDDDDKIARASKAFGALRKSVFGTALYQDRQRRFEDSLLLMIAHGSCMRNVHLTQIYCSS